jgi:type III restriction enzyme
MDKGAHFFRCDFQVHTPRDLGWEGQEAVSNDEREKYAEEFIIACRNKGIDAVAITDHHDLTFFKYIKEAAEKEVDSSNSPVPLEKRIVIYPGMELTLARPPCQAILILDSNFPVNMLSTLYHILAINQNNSNDSKHAQVERLANIDSLERLYELLNHNEFLKDKFIILPNVGETGNDTLLRSGFHDFYRKMPCVGGYLDGAYSQLGNGNLRILSGKDRNYGPKKLGIFQTSDNRHRDHRDLGVHTTWVKWATPTAEALRQACLARESRISQNEPSLPSIYITGIDVSNSKFMGPIYLVFNQQYNSLIGGRGTGKSTILEYLRWGLCDQSPESLKSEDEMPEYQEKRKKLIDRTLLPFDSTVQISFMKNNIPHIVKRKSKTNEIVLKIGDSEFEPCDDENVRNLLPIQAYSQKQLSSVGVSLEELKRLIYSPIRQTLNEFESKVKKLNSEIRDCYELRQRKRSMENEIEKNELELKSLAEQIDKLRRDLKGISEDDRKVISIHEQYENAEQIIEGWQGELAIGRETVDDIKSKISGYPTSLPKEVELPNSERDLIVGIQEEIAKIFKEVDEKISLVEKKLEPGGQGLAKLNELLEGWDNKLREHKRNYETAKQKSTSHEDTLDQIQKIEDRIKEIRKSLLEKKQIIFKTGDPELKFNILKEDWFNIHKEKGDLLESQCIKLSTFSDNNLKAILVRGRGTTKLEETLKNIVYGANVRKEKIEDLCNKIQEASEPIQTWDQILSELEQLAIFNETKESASSLPSTPILSSVGFTNNEIRRMAEKINSENWIDLFLVELEDLPLFEYRTREGEYIDFSDASAGQQATALMYVLLNQDGPPLIIDQPEEDLDNQMVSDIAALIWEAKKKRQIIFASHNANIVVNGDAELIACCNYKVAGDQSKGEIAKLGAIDIEEIRYEITRVMEGGEEAFKLRKEKYGF